MPDVRPRRVVEKRRDAGRPLLRFGAQFESSPKASERQLAAMVAGS